MYLREMGSVELLSREGEIAIAKRIEAGREAMIAGLSESPLTFQAIIIWQLVDCWRNSASLAKSLCIARRSATRLWSSNGSRRNTRRSKPLHKR
jgi:Sigma-70 factor, region 1.2